MITTRQIHTFCQNAFDLDGQSALKTKTLIGELQARVDEFKAEWLEMAACEYAADRARILFNLPYRSFEIVDKWQNNKLEGRPDLLELLNREKQWFRDQHKDLNKVF